MFPIIGFALLLLVLSICAFLPIFNFWSLRKGGESKLPEITKITFALSAATLVCAVLSQLCLIYSFVISDYSVANVYQNSHRLKPLIYKISGSWGNHEGSMLLLISILSAYSFAFNYLSKISDKQKIIISSSQSAIIGLLAAFTAFTSSPFSRIFPAPLEGLGLNPLLQDIGLALHPPMLYTGYIGFSLVFSFAIAGLLTEKIDREFSENLKKWLFFSYGFLTLGIGLGSWWAYRELGWGGYWFWDPVENISLMPWIAATALIHCLKILEKREIFKIWTAFLSILTFILCLLGIFLVRSGVLTSVHSFAIDLDRGFFIITLIFIIGGAGLLIFGAKMSSLKSAESKIYVWSKIGAILFNNYILMIALFVVLLGTTYPIFSRGFFDQFVSIGASYYNKIFTILILPFLAFFAFSNQLHYFENTSINNRRTSYVVVIAIMITSLTFFYQAKSDILQLLVLFLAIFSALMTLIVRSNLVMTLAHFGFSIIIVGVVLSSSFGITKEENLQIGQSLKIANRELKFVDIEHKIGKNFLARQGNFIIVNDQGKKLGKLAPQLRYYPVSEQNTNEASIKNGIFSDIYLVIGNKDEKENYAVRAYYKPFIYLIWLGCFLIFFSAILKCRFWNWRLKIFYVKHEK